MALSESGQCGSARRLVSKGVETPVLAGDLLRDCNQRVGIKRPLIYLSLFPTTRQGFDCWIECAMAGLGPALNGTDFRVHPDFAYFA